MVRKLLGLVVALGLVGLFAQGCAGDPGNSEGDSCSGDDCYGNLICQPVQGRSGDYCCPAPNNSSYTNCQAVTSQPSGPVIGDAGGKG
jgi:hypothetical protein